MPERPPRLRLIRAFLSLLVGFMGGLVGWVMIMLVYVLRQGTTAFFPRQLPPLPMALHLAAFLVPGIAAAVWFFKMLGTSR